MSLATVLRTASGIVLLAALAVAPLYYGGTRVLPLQTLTVLLALGGAMWVLSCAAGRTWFLPPMAARYGIGLVAVSGIAWLFFLSPPDWPEFTRRHVARVVARWPNSVVPQSFSLTLLWSAAAIVALLAFHDLARSKAWRYSIAAVILITGAIVALVGLVQNATRAQGIYWIVEHRMPGAFFGTFFHHTSAGAYLNTVWPIGFAIALTAIRTGIVGSPGLRLIIFGALVCAGLALAAHAGHISRLPQVIALVCFVSFALWAGVWRALGEVRGLRPILVAATVAVAVGAVVVGATRFGIISERWQQLSASHSGAGSPQFPAPTPPLETWPQLVRDDLFIPSDHRAYPLGDRGAAYFAAIDAIRARPWFGWGPDGWTAAAAAHSGDPFIRTFYLMLQFTHQDYLQTCIEWGLIGAAGWALLVPGACIHGIARLGPRPSHDFIGAAAVTSLAAVLAQSLIDFPLQIPAVQLNAVALAALAWSVPSRPPFFNTSHPFNHS